MAGETPQDPEREGRKPASEPRDAAYWAPRVERLEVPGVPEGAINLNVSSRREVGALQGFGQLWQKTYRVELAGVDVTPAEVFRVWKERFPEFQPPQSRFYPPLAGVAPGEVLLINASMRGVPVYTGVRVIYADEESFTVMTPEGHPESGWNTFSAYRDDDGRIVAQVRSLARANDPIYELGFRIAGSTEQERIWTHVLKSLAAHFGANEPVSLEKVLVDPKVQWSQARNVRHNAGFRSILYAMAAPFRRSPEQYLAEARNGESGGLREVELSAGTVEYEDTGGDGPVLVLLHGLAQNGSVWRNVVADLRGDHRCIVPTLPLGGHRRPMRPDADLSMRGLSRLVAEFLERLDLRDVTLVENDWGGAHLLVTERGGERVARLVLTSCEAFDNYPPGLPGRAVWLAAKVPGGLNAMVQPLRLRPLRRLPFAFGWMSKRPVPDEVMDGWLRPLLTRSEVRRDLRKYLRAVDKRDTLEAAGRLRSFNRPALVVWAKEDRVMPPEHGRRLAGLLPQGRLVEMLDSYTLIPEDQPEELARLIRGFVRDAP
ncbi:Haloalkane dehalogenase [Rubrobacter xylanophilus DSM 9941]|nr:alpha/beta fold hydrolase [Rubrobacter xylanophilus]QYJ15557.1 Haloalkane dehalogenase [Rubrobacter xylanophilus DSM 9941]